MSKFVMIIQVFVAQSNPEDSLSKKLLQRMIDLVRIAKGIKAFGESADQSQFLAGFPQQQGAGI